MEPLDVVCPYCWQSITFFLDPDIISEITVIEDCSVCCRPIEITYTVVENTITCKTVLPIEGNAF